MAIHQEQGGSDNVIPFPKSKVLNPAAAPDGRPAADIVVFRSKDRRVSLSGDAVNADETLHRRLVNSVEDMPSMVSREEQDRLMRSIEEICVFVREQLRLASMDTASFSDEHVGALNERLDLIQTMTHEVRSRYESGSLLNKHVKTLNTASTKARELMRDISASTKSVS